MPIASEHAGPANGTGADGFLSTSCRGSVNGDPPCGIAAGSGYYAYEFFFFDLSERRVRSCCSFISRANVIACPESINQCDDTLFLNQNDFVDRRTIQFVGFERRWISSM